MAAKHWVVIDLRYSEKSALERRINKYFKLPKHYCRSLFTKTLKTVITYCN